MTNHNGPSGQWEYETVRVVFRTHDGDDYETIDREEWIDYSDGSKRDIITHKDLVKKYQDKLANGETLTVQDSNNKPKHIEQKDVQSISVTPYIIKVKTYIK